MPRQPKRSKNRDQPNPTVSFRIPAELVEALEQKAQAKGVTPGEIGRMALEAFVRDRRSGPEEGYTDAKNRAHIVMRHLIDQIRERLPDSVEEFDAMAASADETIASRRKR